MSNQASVNGATASSTRVDILIVTALKKERNSILERLDGDYETIQEELQPITYYRGRVAIPSTEEHYDVVLVLPQDMGNIDSGIIATLAMERWRPQCVLMVGIGGGVEGKVGLGDVVVGKYTHYYEPSKVTPSGTQHRFERYPSDPVLYEQAFMYEANDWKGDIRQPIPGERATAWKPDAHFGPIGSGEQVVADSITLGELLEDCPKMLAVAMEGAGVAKAVRYAVDQPRFLEIRGISDFADDKKGDDWQEVAADTAAAFAIGFLRTRPVPPRTLEVSPAAKKLGPPLLLLRAESLRQIGNSELIAGLPEDLRERDVSMISLDFTDLVVGGVFQDPEEAVRRLTGPESQFLITLAQNTDAEIVFCGLAHIPLVVLAGHLVTDRQKVHLMDYHPSPGSETWAWPTDPGAYPELLSQGFPRRLRPIAGDAVVRMSISYHVTAEQTAVIVPDPVLSVDLRIPEPDRDIVKSEAQVRAYGRVFRQTLDRIARDFPTVQRVHLFYAGPVSLAFHIGQQISENIHPPVVVWNYHRVYDWGLDLGAAIIGEESVLRRSSTNKRD